ncbi:serine protease [Bradyrhizobium sp. dw_78]|uniref:S1 family peptidase n=1 Tax=Bradyrhizobium sp. dw_78 TaxID=2719793 RepID=UPI001BD5B475|nr:serine protease [Bradyrhizobium sp. dw_78]
MRVAPEFLLLLLLSWLPAQRCLADDKPERAVVYIQVGYRESNVFVPVEDGTGFLINDQGWVATANHLLEVQIPSDKQREIRGGLGSIDAEMHQLFATPGPVVSADIALLRFSPALASSWPHLKILSNYAFTYLQPIVAYGFPSVPQRQELSARPGKVTGLLGPHNSIQVNAGLAPGMSGGPWSWKVPTAWSQSSQAAWIFQITIISHPSSTLGRYLKCRRPIS